MVEPRTEAEKQEWESHLAELVSHQQRKKAAKDEFRADHQRRRKYGKATYHQSKLARLREAETMSRDNPKDPPPNQPPGKPIKSLPPKKTIPPPPKR